MHDRIKILIVDDQERLLRVLRLGLKEYPVDVKTVNNGEDALKALFDEAYDLVITDIRMPVMSGVELIYEIERYEMALPVIVMTAHADVDDAVKVFKHGAVDYIKKPFSVEELYSVIERVLEKHGATKDVVDIADLKEAVEDKEKEVIIKALQMCANNKAEVAKRLNISERNLWYKIKKYGL